MTELVAQEDKASDSSSTSRISPEGLQIAEAYLENGSDSNRTALAIGIPASDVDFYLRKREVRSYIDTLFFEAGFRNRDKMYGIIDAVIDKKLEDMDETDTGSNKDIMEIMDQLHKMKMAELKMQIEMQKVQNATTIKTQNNVQINGGSEGYNKLMQELLK